jgi:hypothetical protein
MQRPRFAFALRDEIERCTNSDIIGQVCKIVMRSARRDVEIAKTRLIAFTLAQSKRAKPY